MTVWTIQPASALEDIERNGVFRCDESKSFNLSKPDSLKPAYKWLMGRMEERIGPPPEGVAYPVWAWHTWDFLRQPPEPDSAAFLRTEGEKVLLELDIPENALVLTDYEAWQGVMMDSFVPGTADPETLEIMARRLETLEGEELRREIISSWDNVFITDPVNTQEYTRGRYVQATFWELRREYVVNTRRIPGLK